MSEWGRERERGENCVWVSNEIWFKLARRRRTKRKKGFGKENWRQDATKQKKLKWKKITFPHPFYLNARRKNMHIPTIRTLCVCLCERVCVCVCVCVCDVVIEVGISLQLLFFIRWKGNCQNRKKTKSCERNKNMYFVLRIKVRKYKSANRNKIRTYFR